ncbi:B-cell CLL/lymphoma 9-like protein isoform X4 [Pseudophryne corroboree]|uniref:B-cell CLL/lymphoma 9-like protein isoform X4 n=1 Tax=Pseudophryne corroboree TaxID=495146 RepID=UPI0030815DCA
MHSESKLANHGKASSNGGQSQPPNVSQGPKGTGLLGPKANHMSPSGVGLKSTPNQGPNHGTGQRDSAGEVGEQRESGTPSLEPESKGELAPRSKRRCVLERKQPYSGDEWCSGPDSEEDEKSLVVPHNCNAGDSVMSASTIPGSGSASLPGLNDSSSTNTPHGAGQGLHAEGGGPGGPSKTPSQFVYVFTTFLANTAAEAVLQGRADSILLYHQQKVPRAKLDEDALQKPPSTPDPVGEVTVPNLPLSTSPTPANHPTTTPNQVPATALQTDAVVEETNQELTPNTLGNGSSRPVSVPANPPPAASAPIPGDDSALVESAQETGVTLNQDGLSREQLEHRERSLQTLRDIERLLLRSGANNESFSKHTPSPVEGSVPPHPQPHVPSNLPTPMKKYEEPLQSMITQTQSLGGPAMEQDMGGPQCGPDMGHQMSLMMQRLGQDSLTPEQAAWRKLQEEYYAEKRRKEEHMSIHGRSAPDMVLRGPPPPYHSKPGEQWISNRLPGPLEGQEPMQLRGGGITFQGPRFPGRYGGMQNLPMDTMGVMQRQGRWPEDLSPMGGGQGGFPQGGMGYPGGGQGEAERFLNPHSREEFLRQQLLEKRPAGMQRQLSVPGGQGIDMERVMMQQRPGEPSMFQADSMGSGRAMGMDFGGSRGMLSPTLGQQLRELDPTMGGGNLNMNMSVNMNMNLNLQMAPHQQMLLSQKMRSGGDLMGSQGGVGTEELVRAAQAQNGSGMTGGGQKMVIQDGTPTQNPLSLMMSQMSKYAMPSSTPLYHNAIKTIATSDDELLPDRILLPPGSQQGPGMNTPVSLHLNMSSSQSPMGNIRLQGQPPLSHEPTPMLNSPGPPMHPSIGSIQNPMMISSVNQDTCCPCPGSQMMSSNQLVFPPRLQPGPPHNPPLSHGGGGSSMQQHYPDEVPNQPRLHPRLSDPYGPGLPSLLTDPDLGEVMRTSASGIPEFDLSRIMPSEKPSSTLQYFPKGSTQPPKPHPTNMHLLGLQNMMVEQHSGRSGPSLPGQQRTLGVPHMHPMVRTGMAPPPQMTQQNFMLMKQRSVSGEMYPQSANMLSPQGALGGHLHGQQSMMVGHQMRQRSVSLDTYIPGPGHLPF